MLAFGDNRILQLTEPVSMLKTQSPQSAHWLHRLTAHRADHSTLLVDVLGLIERTHSLTVLADALNGAGVQPIGKNVDSPVAEAGVVDLRSALVKHTFRTCRSR